MIDIEVHHVELAMVNGQRMYMSTITFPSAPVPEGEIPQVLVRVTPDDTFETLAAEYRIDVENDPNGWDDVLELWAAMSYMGDQAEDQLEDPDHLFNAPTVEHAKRKRLQAARKKRGGGRLRGVAGESRHRVSFARGTPVEDSAEEDPLEFIKRTAPMSQPHMQLKARYVHAERNKRRAMRAQVEMETAQYEGQEGRLRDMKLYRRESTAELATRLLGNEVTDPMNPPSALNHRRG